MVSVRVAAWSDCEALAATSKSAFDHDVHFGADSPGGPPGYDSVGWHQRALTWGRVFVLADDGRVVGGAIAIERGPGWVELGRVWLVPELQNRGLGGTVLGLLEDEFPNVRRWTLETPVWNLRNQHFYTTQGYLEVGREGDDVRFEKLLDSCRCDQAQTSGALDTAT